jgi:glycogen debranching enzyme
LDSASVRRRLWDDLVRLRAPEGYLRAGAPRYGTLFGRDALIAAWQTLAIDPTIAASTLRILAKYQGKRSAARSEEEPGKILHEHRFDVASQRELPDWDFPYFGSIDSTPLFIVVAGEYANRVEDDALLNDLWSPLQSAYRWMSEYGDRDGDGYLEYERRNPRGLLHQGWKDGMNDHLGIAPPVALVEVQGYALMAHEAYARLAARRGERDEAARAEAAANRLREALNRDFWIPDRQFFALALDGSKRPRRAITSNPGHLLVTQAVRTEYIEPVVQRLFQPDLWTPYGVRTLSSADPGFNPFGYHTGAVWPHDNWFLYTGLNALGRHREAERVKVALLNVWEELGKIPELYAVVDDTLVDLSRGGYETSANPLQAWASAGLLDMLQTTA